MQSAAPSTFWVPKSTSNSWIPEGYVLMTGPDNKDYIAPEFMVPVLDQDFNAKEKKKELKVSGALGTVSSQLSPIIISDSGIYSLTLNIIVELRGHQ
jgi:hypothetical protein